MTVEQARAELERILYDKDYRQRMLDGYEYMAARLGDAGAPKRAAQEMVRLLRKWFFLHNETSLASKDHKIVKSDKAGAVIARLSYFIVRTCDILWTKQLLR